MGYFLTTQKEGEPLDILSIDILLATEEEMRIAQLVFHSECDKELTIVKEALPEDLANITYKKFLAYYIRNVQNWMNTSPVDTFCGIDYRPSELETAYRNIFVKADLHSIVEEYKNGKVSPSLQEYFISKIIDDDVIKIKKEYDNTKEKRCEDGLMPIGASAFHLIDYEKILPVTVTDRKGFLYYCKSDDGHRYISPPYQLFRTKQEALDKITERNNRRDTTIVKLHLMEDANDEEINRKRRLALDWLDFNQDPPELLIEKLEEVVKEKAV